jgi:hypothetical protein
MVQICEIHPDGTEEILPSMAIDVDDASPALRPDVQPRDGPTVRLRLLPSNSRERICPTIDLDPMVPRPLLLQLQRTYPLAKVPPHQNFFAGLLWQRGAPTDGDDIMEMDNEDAVSTSSMATAGSAGTRTGEHSEDSPGEDVAISPPADERRSTRRKLRVGAPSDPAAEDESGGTVDGPTGAGVMAATQSTAEVDRLAWSFNEWSTDWEVSPQKRVRAVPPHGYAEAAGAFDTRPSGEVAASVGACGAQPPELAAPVACAVDSAGAAEAAGGAGGETGGNAGGEDAGEAAGEGGSMDAGAEESGQSAARPPAACTTPSAPPTTPTLPLPSNCADGLEQRMRQVSSLVLSSRCKRKAIDEAPIDEMTHLHLGASPMPTGGSGSSAAEAFARVVHRRKKPALPSVAGLAAGPCGGVGARAARPIPEGGRAAPAPVRAGG